MVLNNFSLIASSVKSRKRKNKIKVLKLKILPIIDIRLTIRQTRRCKRKESQERLTHDKIFRHNKAN